MHSLGKSYFRSKLSTCTDCTIISGDEVFPVEEATGLMAMGDTHYLDTWRTLEKIFKNTNKIKAIGLSNFTQQQIQGIIDNGSVVPAIHQIELHRE